MLVFIYGVYSSSAMGIEGLNAPFYIVGLPLFGVFTFVFHKLYKYLYYIYFWDEYDYILVLYQISIMIILSFATSVVWTVARVLDDSDSQGCGGAVEIDISQAPDQPGTNDDGGKYGSGGITIQVTKFDIGGTNKWVRYKHSNTDGFTLKKITHSDKDMTGTGQNALTGNMNKPIGSQGAIYVYYDAGGANLHQPKVICISTGNPEDPTKNTWYVAGANESSWVFQSNGINGKRKISEVTASNLTTATQNSRLTVQGDNIIIKLDKRPNTTNIRYRTKDKEVTVERLTDNSGFKGYKHYFANPETINTIKIHGNEINGIQPSALANKQYVYVYYSTSDDNLQRPYLICLKDYANNKWYKRQNKFGGGYTWSIDSEFTNTHDPNLINTLATNLKGIKSALTEDQGYPKPDDRPDDLPTPETTPVTSVTIQIEKTAIGYDSNGNDKYDASQIAAGNVKVFLKNNEPKIGYKRYKHKVQGDPGKYKKMSTNVTYKNKGSTVTLNADATSDVHYVYVYFGMVQGTEKPLLICVAKDGEWTYYTKTNPSDSDNQWSPETTLNNKNPENADHKNHIIMHLDKLNDQANRENVIHLEKTNEKGVISSGSDKIYKTGTGGNTQITVSKTDGGDSDNKVPDGYVRYKHQGSINSPKFKHNGIELSGINETSAEAIYVYYSKTDTNHEFPLIVCVKTSISQTYYKRGNSWKAEPQLSGINPENPNNPNPNGLNTLKTKLDEVKATLEPYSGLAKLFGIGDEGNYHILHWSPIFLVALSLGTVYFFYPAISPYQLVDDPFDGKKIELWIQAISATPHIAFAITQLREVGPGRTWRQKWEKKKSCKCKDCCKTGSTCTCTCTATQTKCNKCCCCKSGRGCCYEQETGGDLYAIYHATWLFFIPYIICIYIFFSMMHFPNGRIGKYFRASVFRTGALCVVFAWVQEFMEAAGFGGGMGTQVSGKSGDNDHFNSDAGTVNGLSFHT